MAKKSPRGGDQASDEFLLAYGHALMKWSNLEVILAYWFNTIIGMENWEAAYAVFFSARSFTGRSEMFAAAVGSIPDKEPHKAFLKECLVKAVAYSTTRNEIAHGVIHSSNDKQSSVRKPARYWQPGNITIKELDTAAHNFSQLRDLIYLAHKGFTGAEGGWSIPECVEWLRRLPNEACSSELSQNQKGRERQQKAALRNKSRP